MMQSYAVSGSRLVLWCPLQAHCVHKFVLNPLQFDFSFFNTTTVPVRNVSDGKFPAIEPNYEIVEVKDLFIGE